MPMPVAVNGAITGLPSLCPDTPIHAEGWPDKQKVPLCRLPLA
jgi:hypothetical protein